MAANTIVRGDDLMVFFNDKSIAYATAHTLSMSTETADISSKDHGRYSATEPVKITWEITSENLYTEVSFNELFGKMQKMEKVQLKFGMDSDENRADPEKTVANGGITDGYWSPKAQAYYEGEAYITSLSANANTGEKATFSATFTGVGVLKSTYAPAAAASTQSTPVKK